MAVHPRDRPWQVLLYVVLSQLWLTIVRAGLCRRFGETKRDPARISETAGKTPVMATFRIDDLKPLTGSGRVSPMCAVHTSFLLTLLTMSNTMGFAKKRVFSKTAVPICFQSKFAHSVNRWTSRLSLAGPGSERRTPQVNKSS